MSTPHSCPSWRKTQRHTETVGTNRPQKLQLPESEGQSGSPVHKGAPFSRSAGFDFSITPGTVFGKRPTLGAQFQELQRFGLALKSGLGQSFEDSQRVWSPLHNVSHSRVLALARLVVTHGWVKLCLNPVPSARFLDETSVCAFFFREPPHPPATPIGSVPSRSKHGRPPWVYIKASVLGDHFEDTGPTKPYKSSYS